MRRILLGRREGVGRQQAEQLGRRQRQQERRMKVRIEEDCFYSP
jgi:hypothetical protein